MINLFKRKIEIFEVLLIIYSLSPLLRDNHLKNIFLLISIILLIFIFYKKKIKIPRCIKIETIVMGIILLIIIIKLNIELLTNNQFILAERFILNFINIFLLTCIFNFKTFYKTLEGTVIFLCTISIILFFLINSGLGQYINFFINKSNNYAHILVYGFKIGREFQNAGIVWEPSAYGILLGIILYFRIIRYPIFNPLEDLGKYILIIGLLTTKATTAYIILILNIFYLLIKVKLNLKKLIMIILILVSLLNSSLVKEKIYYKLINSSQDTFVESNKYGSQSSGARKMHFLIDYEIFKNNIFFGDMELENEKSLIIRRETAIKLSEKYKYMKYFLITDNEYQITSNSLLSVLAYYGLMIFLLYNIILFKFLFYKINLESIFYSIIILVSLASQYIFTDLFFIYLWFLPRIFLEQLKGEDYLNE